MKRQILFFTLVLLSFLSYSIDVPKTQGFVSDYENIFTPEQITNLNNIISEYETEQVLKSLY